MATKSMTTPERGEADRRERYIRAAEQNLKKGYRLVHRDCDFYWTHPSLASLSELRRNVRSIVETFSLYYPLRFTGILEALAEPVVETVPEEAAATAPAAQPAPQLPAVDVVATWHLMSDLTALIGARPHMLRDWRKLGKITSRLKDGRAEVLADAVLVERLARNGIHIRLTGGQAAVIEQTASSIPSVPETEESVQEPAEIVHGTTATVHMEPISGDGAGVLPSFTRSPNVLPWDVPEDEAEDDEGELLARLEQARRAYEAAREALLTRARHYQGRAAVLMEAAGR